MSFTRAIAIDWSGAKGRRHKGIAIAEARAGKAPVLIRPGHVWSRREVLAFLKAEASAEPTLFGFDFSFAPPFQDAGAYLPGETDVPRTARAFWAHLDGLCADEDLGAASFVDQHHRRHFWCGAADGAKADYLRWRRCEAHLRANGRDAKIASLFEALGPSQVGKASFAGMRLLHALDGTIPIWPFDRPEPGQSLIVEIYTRFFIRLAGRRGHKIRTIAELDAALDGLGSPRWRGSDILADHHTDVLISAAGMLRLLSDGDPFDVPALDQATAQTEGWTFGVGCANGARDA